MRYTMFAVRLPNGRWLQPAHTTKQRSSSCYEWCAHYSNETGARIARGHDGRGGEIVAVDDDDQSTMRVVA